MITPEELAGMDPAARAALKSALTRLEEAADPLADPLASLRRLRFLTFLVCCCALLIPWIVFLGVTLPTRYRASQWGAAWIGFDIALLAALATTAWAVWRRRQVAIVCTVISGTLLVCDAWFDLMFSWGDPDLWVSIATAVLGELPLAGLMFFLSWRLLTFTVQIVWLHFGLELPPPPLRYIELFTLITRDRVAEPPTVRPWHRSFR